MKVAPRELGFPLAMDDPNRDRTVLHASDIYNLFYQKIDPKRYGGQNDPDMLFAEGLAWEQYLEKVLIAQGVECFRPGEQIAEWKGKRVAFSPDLILCGGLPWVTPDKEWIGEIKKAWKSSRLKPTDKDFRKYLTQGKLYAYWTGIPRVTWLIDHTVGNWRDYPLPTMKVWTIEFTKRELLDEVHTMMRFAEQEDLFAKAEAGLLRNPAALPRGAKQRR